MARRRVPSGAEGGTAVPGRVSSGRDIAGGVACPGGFPRVSYFFGKIPVWLVPPQKTLVPTRSRRPLPAQVRQRRNEPL
jgi:hypothetical protein